jgi:hypothetical protein
MREGGRERGREGEREREREPRIGGVRPEARAVGDISYTAESL